MIPYVMAVGGSGAALGNGVWCQGIAPVNVPPFVGTGSGNYNTQVFENPTYQLQLGAGVTAGTLSFQELWIDKTTWLNVATPAGISLVTATSANYNGVISGWFLGIRMVIAGITGGTAQYALIKTAIRTL